jgi:3-deoxy-manno-octulosonate cytidylyltransferase (CMP-KDO synthetase)
MRTLGVIPARLASTRLPRKVLRQVAGRPLLAWVVDAARACPQLDQVLVAADSEEVVALCRQLGFPVQLTSPDLPSGTDRVHAIAQLVDAEIYVNIQGDEPLLRPEHIAALLRPFAHPDAAITTLRVPCTPENIANPNAVKVVTAADGRALYFSRATIPYDRDAMGDCHPERSATHTAMGDCHPERSATRIPTGDCHPERSATRAVEEPVLSLSKEPASGLEPPTLYWKHIGLYAYRKAALNSFPTLPASRLERTERLEQLRFLENGFTIYVEPTDFDTIGVDTEADLRLVESILLRR